MGVLIFNTIISTVQEMMSKKVVDKLTVLASSKVKVVRNSTPIEIDINSVVLDDITVLALGSQVVCDSIIKKGTVEVNESFITGEVEPVVKTEGDTLLSGSFIVSGLCYAKVDHIGKDNYISKISIEAKYNKKVNSIIMSSFLCIINLK